MQELEANSIAKTRSENLRPHQPRFRATSSGPAERSAIFAKFATIFSTPVLTGSRMFHYSSCLSLRKIPVVAIVNVSRGVTVTDCNRLPGFFCTVLCINLFLLCPALLLCRKKIAKQQHSWAQNDRLPQSLQMDLNVSAISVIFTWRKFRLENLKHVVTCMQRRTSLL